jgi:hypothetical protein
VNFSYAACPLEGGKSADKGTCGKSEHQA